MLAATALVGCATPEFLGRPQHPEFELSGRIAVRWHDETSSGAVRWRHHAAGDEMLISTPLGQGVARIVREAGEVTLTTSDDRVYRAPDASRLTEQVLGYPIPLEGLADWVRARPVPGRAVSGSQLDSQGRLSVLEQDGWRIEYLAWDEARRLPQRLRLSYPSLEMRVAISEWQVP